MSKVGDRVGAILSSKDGEVKFLGFGVYVGDKIPLGAAGWLAEGAVEHKITNPKIELDSGKVVWAANVGGVAKSQLKNN